MKCANKSTAIADQLEAIQQMGDLLLEEADIKMDEMQAIYIIRDSERKKKKKKQRKSSRKSKQTPSKQFSCPIYILIIPATNLYPPSPKNIMKPHLFHHRLSLLGSK